MAHWLSEPIETLVADTAANGEVAPCDVLVVGSGYGGAISALRLAGAHIPGQPQPAKVYLFERGNEYALGDFPESIGELPGHIRLSRHASEPPIGHPHALFDLRLGDPVSILVGNGLGGTSLINANVALEPDEDVFRDPSWPAALRHKSALAGNFDAVRRLLDVAPMDPRGLKKFAALQRVAAALGSNCQPAPIAVTTVQGSNGVGVAQNACIGCGNCVTGCNYGAKNTLAMNILPLARSRGAEIYTGATVLDVAPIPGPPAGGGWIVRFRRTATSKGPLASEAFAVRARQVILAAGTLGSTEILLRSRQSTGLRLSDRVGHRFSTNGDVIAFGFGQDTEVNAVAHPDFGSEPGPVDQRHIGPTITGYFSAQAKPADDSVTQYRVTLQDAAVPSALAMVFGEIATTARLPVRLLSAGLSDPLRPAWFEQAQNQHKDPLVVHPGALRHSQVLLAQGDDRAPGVLCLRYPTAAAAAADHDQASVEVVWSASPQHACTHDPAAWDAAAPESVFAAIDTLLAQAAAGADGFDGGDYLANPIWRLLPKKLGALATPSVPGNRLVSVHPLGGCSMGDDRASGVVDDAGRVFDAGQRALDARYDGLYVLDGAIAPGALSVNPLLTIAALAHRGAGLILQRNGWIETTQNLVSQPAWRKPPVSRTAVPLPAQRVAARFDEQLMGRLDRVPVWLRSCLLDTNKPAASARRIDLLEEARGLVACIEIRFDDMHAFLADTRRALHARCTLHANEALTDTIPAEHLVGTVLAEGYGSVELMAWDRPANPGEEWTRAALALLAFTDRRALRDLADGKLAPFGAERVRPAVEVVAALARAGIPAASIQTLIHTIEHAQIDDRQAIERMALTLESLGLGKDVDLKSILLMLASMARHHAQWRTLRYAFNLVGKGGAFTLDGTKVLAYAPGKPDPWTALGALPITLRDTRGRGSACGTLQVDLIELTRRPALQVTASPDMPASLAAMASLGMLFVRALFQTHLWSFRVPSYPLARDRPKPDFTPRLRLSQGAIVVPSATVVLAVPSPALDPHSGDIYVQLVRYRPTHPVRGSILLVHGFAHGSSLFSTDTIAVSLASYLYEAGYDVWLLDHRLSNALADLRDPSGRRQLAELQSSIDEIAEHDIRVAVDHVYRSTGGPIQLMAHCIGAAAVSMAVLAGHCHDRLYADPGTGKVVGRTKIASLVLHAVPPWLVPSMSNRLRANLGAFLKDSVRHGVLDPVPSKDPGAFEKLIDALCSSAPLSKDDAHRHDSDTDGAALGREICARYSAIYGREWNHDNLAAQTHQQLYQLVGVGNLEVFRQIFFMALRQRITARDGSNKYLTKEHVKDRWTFPTLFAHGTDNGVFNPLSSVRSFIRLSILRRPDAALPDAPAEGVYLFEAGATGHLDFILGKDAHITVYPYLDGFFRMATLSAGGVLAGVDPAVVAELNRQRARLPFERDPHWRAPFRPLCGPVIGWSRPAGRGNTLLRVWMEADEDTTAPARNIMKAGLPVPAPIALPAADYPGTYLVGDVRLRAGEQTLDLGVGYASTLVVWNIGAGLSGPLGPPAGDRTRREHHQDPPDARTPVRLQIGTLPWYQRMSSAHTVEGIAFLMGSCRYPGSPFERGMSDAIFAPMLAHVLGTAPAGLPGVDHLLLLGDQIYADATADLFDTLEPRERYAGRYREMLQSKNARALLSQVPTYMAIDDHEIADNWPDFARPHLAQVRQAIVAATAYAWSASALAGAVPVAGLWHVFSSAGLPFFVLDTRTHRALRQAGLAQSAQLMADAQRDALLAWVSANARTDKPQFVVSGSVIAPIARQVLDKAALRRNDDGWIGYPSTLVAVLEHLAVNQIDNVVFLAGDPHLCATARIDITAAAHTVSAWQIVSSALFAPLPFANARACDYDWDTPLAIGLDTLDLRITQTLLSTAPQQFMRVDAVPTQGRWGMVVRTYGADGAQISSRSLF